MADGENKEKEKKEENRIMVYLRVRPAKPGEINEKEGSTYLLNTQPDHKTVLLEGGKAYSYDWVFDGDDVKQEDIFIKVAVPVIENIFKGFWGTMMVYGQTGTGKSFTMCNFDPRCEGIIPRTMRQIFKNIGDDPDRTYTVLFSFIQIYLDRLQDLFNPEGPELKINYEKGVQFPGIKEHTVRDADHFRELYEDGNQHRVVTATKMNPESSRGHAALFIQIKSYPTGDESGEQRNGKLMMIDLAGYERFQKTGVQEGLMKEEAKTINGSLLSLGNVVQALSERSPHVPWRNAKLTRMLQDAIGGRAKCSIILTAGPSSEHMHETLGTLYFGSRAMAVKTDAKLAVNIDYQKLAKKLQDMLSQAESKINDLEIAATQRQLEREEGESRMQAEVASMKARHDKQLQELLSNGASPDKIQEMMKANNLEEELLIEQHYTERAVLEEQHEKAIQEDQAKQQQSSGEQYEEKTSSLLAEIDRLKQKLEVEVEEKERWRQKAKDAEAEARRVMTQSNKDRMRDDGELLEQRVIASAATGTPVEVLKEEYRTQLRNVQEMLEEDHQLQMQELEENLTEELDKYKALYEELKAAKDGDATAVRDTLVAAHEAELREIRATSLDVQEKLKKNHLTIKRSYQAKKEQLQADNDVLLKKVKELAGGQLPQDVVAALQETEANANAVATGDAAPRSSGTLDGAGGGDNSELIAELRHEIQYLTTEKESLEQQMSGFKEKDATGERMAPAAVRRMKEENEKMKADTTRLEKEIMVLKAAQQLSGPKEIGRDMDEEEGKIDDVEEIHGDFEGMENFLAKLYRFPLLPGTSAIQNTHEAIMASLSQDLDDYKRLLKYRIFLMGEPNSGKSSFLKCLTATSVPLMKGVPEVQNPTVNPYIHSTALEDITTSKSEWYKLYVKFEERAAQDNKSHSSPLGALGGVLGIGNKGVPDPSKVFLDLFDMPGREQFWKGFPSYLMPGKSSLYCVVYDASLPMDVVKEQIFDQIGFIHASACRNFPRGVGGDTPRIAFCLIGTHRDGMREQKETASLIAHLNKITLSLGDVMSKLRGEDSYGLVCIGNFAVSCKDWTVASNKGSRGPQTFKDLLSYFAVVCHQLYNNRPSVFVPGAKSEGASHMTYMLGDEVLESQSENTSQLDKAGKRLIQGVITYLTGMHREQKCRWFMSEKDMRATIAQHLGVDVKSPGGIRAANYILRELCVRGVFVVLPWTLTDPAKMPKEDGSDLSDDVPERNAIVITDTTRLLNLYSAFVSPATLNACGSAVSNNKDYAALKKLTTLWQDGFYTQDVATQFLQRHAGLVGNDLRNVMELLCIMGLGLGARQELAILAPSQFQSPMPLLMEAYIPYLLASYGDGIGRKYKFNFISSPFFSRMQLKLVPFSHGLAKDKMEMNYADASYLMLEKSRLKWGVLGSKHIKEAVAQVGVPLRGIMKVEENVLYIAITARGASSTIMNDAATKVLQAIHDELMSLCRREFRGMRASFQEMVIGGCTDKRMKLNAGIQTILTRHGAGTDAIRTQISLAQTMGTDPKGGEIEAALAQLPRNLFR